MKLFVLVIDDDSAIAAALQRSLQDFAIVQAAQTDEEARASVESHPRIDAIVLDGQLTSDTTTVELLKELRRRLGDAVLIIAHSVDHGLLLVKHGADAVVRKGDRAGMTIRTLLLSRFIPR